jgi:2-methylaconitate cis-trans-isomerase PrpF
MSRARVPAVLMRGGTSKGVFVRDADLPPPGEERDRAILALMGSPDPAQINGLGGATSSTSKLISVSPSSEPGCDVEYLFAQVAVDRAFVDYGGNCGNLTAAVGPYAIEEGLVAPSGLMTVLTLFNRNTRKRVRTHIPVHDGKPMEEGDFVIAGVPGTGARIVNEFLDPGGSVLGSVLPTGRAVDTVQPAGGPPVEVSILDVASPMAFLRASDVGIGLADHPRGAPPDADLMGRLEAIRAACAHAVGLVDDPADATLRSPALPRLALLSPAHGYFTASGLGVDGGAVDVVASMLSMQKVHHAFAATGLMCLAAAARLPGTLAYEMCRPPNGEGVRIGHPKGVAEVGVILGAGAMPTVDAVVVSRTARRLMAGEAYYHDRA